MALGPVSRKPWKRFGHPKKGVYYAWKLCMKGTSGHLSNVWIKQLCNHKVWEVATALRMQKLFRTLRNEAPAYLKIDLQCVLVASAISLGWSIVVLRVGNGPRSISQYLRNGQCLACVHLGCTWIVGTACWRCWRHSQ